MQFGRRPTAIPNTNDFVSIPSDVTGSANLTLAT